MSAPAVQRAERARKLRPADATRDIIAQPAKAWVVWPEGNDHPLTDTRCTPAGGRGRATASCITFTLAIAPTRTISATTERRGSLRRTKRKTRTMSATGTTTITDPSHVTTFIDAVIHPTRCPTK